MLPLRNFFAAILLGFCLSSFPVLAADPPTREAVQQSLDKIADRKLPDADQKALQQVLEQTLGFIDSKSDNEKKLTALKQQLNDAQKQISENQRELTRLKGSKVIPVAQRYGSLDVPQLENMLSERSTLQGELQKALSDASSMVITAQ
ncbi:mechanosensitive channel MscK, partial [Pseudomonas quasicaspiana]|nr:mechanosensitive channel MscK [Pseudomonas quasicaspiana]